MPASGLRACPQQGAAAEADGGGCLLRCGHGRGRPRGVPPSGAAAPWNAVPYGYTSLPAQCMRACPALDAGTAPDRQQNTGGVGAGKFSLTAGAFAPIIERLTGCSAVGSALGSGPRGRGFKSPHSDQLRLLKKMQPLKPLLRQGFQPFQRTKFSTSRDGDAKGHFRDVG